MWVTTDEDRANARGGVNSPAARAAQEEMRRNAERRRARQAKQRARWAAFEEAAQ